jgi:regulator of sigma E protease
MLQGLGPLQIALAVLGIGMLIAWHELGHYAVARLLGMRVLKYSIGFGPKLFGFKHKDIEYQIAALPLGGFVQIKGMSALEEGAEEDPKSFINRPRWARFLVLGAGPGFNYAMAAVLMFVYIWAWPSPLPDAYTLEITEVSAASAAEEAGLVSGDLISKVDGAPASSLGDLKRAVIAKNGEPLTLELVGKDGSAGRSVTLAPRANKDGALLIGVGAATRYPRVGVVDTAVASVNFCFTETERTLSAFGALFRREPGVDVGSPVAIVADMKSRIASGLRSFIFILAMLSVNLGLLNLLPVPSLDGIKMLFLAGEGLARRDLNAKFQVYVNAVGLLALLGLMVVLMARDTLRLLG